MVNEENSRSAPTSQRAKGSPCSHCKSSGSICRTTRHESQEPRARVIITKEYEKKIDRIGDRLANIEELLRGRPTGSSPIANATVAGQSSGRSEASPAATSTGSLNEHSPAVNRNEAYDATPSTHSLLATKVVEQAVTTNPSAFQNPELVKALESLRSMLGKVNDNFSAPEVPAWRWTSRASSQMTPVSKFELTEILKRAESSAVMTFNPELTIEQVREMCWSVFSRNPDCTTIRRVLVYGLLFNFASEIGGVVEPDAFALRCRQLEKLFLNQLEMHVAELPLLLQPSVEAVLALYTAANAGVEMGKPYLALSLTSAMAFMVLALGYHRLSSMQADSPEVREKKIFRFWMVYMFDQSFSVRMGRAPVIRDFYISVPPLCETTLLPQQFKHAFLFWIAHGSIQCQIVEHLYSPPALSLPSDERSRRATELTSKLEKAWSDHEKYTHIPNGPISEAGFDFIIQESDQIMYYSTLALIDHARPHDAGSDSSPALNNARLALHNSIAARKRYAHLPDYVWAAHCHWALLYAPFTPFTVTFCHIISHATTADEDLQLLADYVSTLQSLAHFSEGVVRLYRLCDIFQKVAVLYVQVKKAEMSASTAEYAGPAADEIDDYLSTIGFAPSSADGNFQGTSAGMGGAGDFNAMQLDNWFSGNSSLMGLLEQDFSFEMGPGGLGMVDGTSWMAPS